jgi:hypothetical protein
MANCDSKFNPEDLYNKNLSFFSGKNPIIEAIENTRRKTLQPPMVQPPMMQPPMEQKFVFTQQQEENPIYKTSEGLILSTLANGKWIFLNHNNKWCKLNTKFGRIIITQEGFIALHKANGDCVFLYRN